MKPWKVLSSSLLILLGFTAGIALRTTPTTVSAADPTPPKPLTSVAHDSTLNGDGTAASRLGLANGAVGVAKLSPSRLPSTGQVLGFDGAGLTWKTPFSAAHVVDNVGKDVGPANPGGGSVLLRIQGVLFIVGGIGPSGYVGDQGFRFLHTSSDCSGQRYMPVFQTEFALVASMTSTQLIYPGAPIQQRTFRSEERVESSNPDTIGHCFAIPDDAAFSGPVARLDLSTLNFTPPFHLEY